MLEPGRPAPPFSLRDQHSDQVSLDDMKGQPGLIVFMPLAFTRVCSGEMGELRDNLATLGKARLVVITCDNVPTNRAWAESSGFEFPILSDFWPHGEVTRAYGCFDERIGVARRSTFVIDDEAIITDVISTDHLREARPFDAYVEALSALGC